MTTPTTSWIDRKVASRTSMPFRRTAPDAHVVEPGHQMADRRLARPRRPHQGHQLAGPGRERHVEEDLVGRALVEDGHRLERGQRHLLGPRIAEVDVVELDGGRPAGNGDGIGLLVDHGGQVEDLEDPVERHQRRHDVDLDVRQRRERPVEPVQVGHQSDQ